MNHIHQIIWNKNLGAWIVASELAKRGKKRGSIRRKALILPLLIYASAGIALPTGNELVAGSVNVSTPSAQQMQINQSSQKAIVNWQGFSIGQQESVNIQQPNASAALLNRVVGQDASNIQGRLNANGQVYLANPNGVIFSKTAQVDVGGLIASTHAISNKDFLDSKLRFTQGHAQGSVINQGQIKTPEGGVVALIGEQVENTGNISTPKGTTALAAGKTVDLDMQGDGLVEVKITEATLKAQIKNSGVIQAEGGQVVMTAKAAGQLLNTVINNEGVIEARGLVEKNGKIVLSGGDNGVVQVSGALDASGQATSKNVSHTESTNTQGGNITVSGGQIHIYNGATLNADSAQINKQGNIQLAAQQDITLDAGSKISANNAHGNAGTIHIDSKTGTTLAKGTIEAKTTHLASLTVGQSGKGGNIALLGERVGLVDKAAINASGEYGGGKILVGGDYQGKNPAVHNAKAIYIGQNTSIKADAKIHGDGGKVIAWSNEATRAYGNISAKGGSQSGNGGFIETSGHWLDTAGIKINASAAHGKSGDWLLDPWDVTIAFSDGNFGGTFLPGAGGIMEWIPNASGSTIDPSTIESALNLGTSVNITTTGAGTEAGNITVADTISTTSSTPISPTLTLKADNAIIINSGVSISAGGSNKLNVILNADADSSEVGNIQMLAGSSITSNGGNIIMGGESCSTSSCTGAAFGYGGSGDQFMSNGGIVFNGNSDSTVSLNSGGGNIWLNGKGFNDPSTGSDSAAHLGIGGNYLNLDSGGGTVNIRGTGGSGVDFSRGIQLQESRLSSQGGVMNLDGSAGLLATGDNNIGIRLVTSTLDSGAGDMTLNGSGGGGDDLNYGVLISNPFGLDQYSLKTTSTLNITGTGGGSGTGTDNKGIGLVSASLNAGIMNLTGTGGSGSDFNRGIEVGVSSLDTELGGSQLASTGAMTLTGRGGAAATGTNNGGITLFSSNLDSGTGDMNLTGSGGGGTDSNSGVFIGVDSTALIASSLSTTATLNITGTGGSGTGGSQATGSLGVGLASASLNAGIMDLTGTGGSGSNFNYGLRASAYNSNLGLGGSQLTSTGAMTLTGFSPATYGLYVELGSSIGNSQQSGSITLKADTNTGSDSIYLDSGDSPATLTGTGNLFLQPVNSATTIGLAGGTGTFNLDANELARMNGFSSITIGNQLGTGLVNIGAWTAPTPPPSSADLTIFGPGGITQTGIITVGSGNNLDLVTSGGNYTNSSGAGALNVSGGGRWLVYAANPSSVIKNGLTSAFRQYNTVYGDTINSTGNGFIYASTPGVLNVDTTLISGDAFNTYGTAPTAAFGYTIGNPSIADNEDLAAISISDNGITFTPTISSTTAAGGYTVNYLNGLSSAAGYTFVPGVGLSYTVNRAELTATIIGNPTKPYDGNTTATLTPANFNLNGFIGEQGASVTQTAGTYNSADVVAADSVTATLAEADFTADDGTLLSNYSLPVSASGAGQISEAALTAAIIGNPTKPYDGNTIATLTPANFNLNGFIGEQGASVTQTAGTYNSANVLAADSVTATLAEADFTADDGTLLSNYSLPVSASGAGQISEAALTAAIIGNPTKPYDGNTIATLTPANFNLNGFIGEQGASVTQTAGTYNSADVVAADTVTATLAAVDFSADDGTLLSNYSLPVSASGAGQISEAALTAAIIGNPTKPYDGNTIATLTPANFNLNGFIGGQGASVTQTAGTYNSADVVAADTVTATLAAVDFSADDGTLLSNYSLPVSASGAGQISEAALTAAIIGNPTKPYDGNTIATLTPANFNLNGFIGEQGASVTQTAGTYNSADVVAADTVTATLAAVDFSADDGTLLSNYSLPVSASGAGQISEAALTAAIIGNPTKPYDGNTIATLTPANFNLNGFIGEQGASVTQTAGTYNSADVVAADTVTATLAAVDFSADDGTLLSNYSLPDTASGAGAITPANLIITANDDRKIFNGFAYKGGNGVTYTGLVNNETPNILGGSLSYGGNSQGAINAGAYDITPGGLSSGNYTITYLNGQLTIVNNPSLIPEYKDNKPVVTQFPPQPPLHWTPNDPPSSSVVSVSSVKDSTEVFAGIIPQYCDNLPSTPANPMVDCQKRMKDERSIILPTLTVKNSAGRVKRLQMSANKQFLSLLLEDGSVRIWDFQQGDQHQIETQNKNLALTDISAVDDQGELVSIASKAGIITQDHIIPTLDENLAMNEPDINQFMTSNDGSLLLVSAGTDQLSLWDSKHNKKLWQLPYERGVVNGLALSDNKQYGAVLSRQPGSYVLLPTELQLKSLTDAVDIVDLGTGKVIKSLPNVGEQVLSMQFKDNDTLQLKLASGELLDWSMATGSPKTAANFAETVTAVDNESKSYAYVIEDGTVRVGDGQGHVLLSIQNKENPFKDAMLLDGDKKLLTVMANGELSLWDVESGKKLLRLFSTQQGWTVMDAFGRFDGSEDAMDNFSWSANEEDIPLDSFSENYYEPGLLSNVLQNQDYLNSNPNMVQNGITLPPKVVLQIAEQQAKTDRLDLQLDVYDRGGGIDKIHVYQNGRILSNENVIAAQQILQDNGAEHRALTLNITPSAGKNTLKVVASNDMGIENSSTELSFDGKTKAYASSLKLLTIGIDQYSDPKLNLKYSVTDADAIGQAMKNTSKVAASINLYNENATKPKILAELKELSQGVQQDVLVIYFAGHGLALGKEWYFLPYETTMQPTLEQIAATGITATELSDIFKNSKIQHILLMVDSCYSGAGMDAFSKLENGQRYFTRKLSRSLGITVMAAAAKDQKAFELKSLGHGLFTYLVTQELQEKTETQPVTAHGIAGSISETLPVFSKKMLGASQEPAVYAKGNDFMLTDVLKESDKGNAADGKTPAIAPKKLDQ